MAYVLKMSNPEDEIVFYIHIDKKTFQVNYVTDSYRATRFESLTAVDEAINYTHIHGFDIEKVK